MLGGGWGVTYGRGVVSRGAVALDLLLLGHDQLGHRPVIKMQERDVVWAHLGCERADGRGERLVRVGACEAYILCMCCVLLLTFRAAYIPNSSASA